MSNTTESNVKSVIKEINETLASKDLTSHEKREEFSRLCQEHGVDENDILFELLNW